MRRSIRRVRGRALAVWSAAVIGSVAIAAAVNADDVPPNVMREIREIQKELGGSVVQGYSELWGAKAKPGPSARPPAPADPQQAAEAVWSSDIDEKSREARLRVEALREAAAKLDEMANLLEPLELYLQADGLREQAQRLRVDARQLAGAQLRPSRAAPPADMAPPPGYMPPPQSEERPASGEFHAPPLFAPDEELRPTPENQRPESLEGSELPKLEPEPQEPRDERPALTPAPLSE